MSVTVVTPTVPEREQMLRAACQSVRLQTRTPDCHLIRRDWNHTGHGARLRNELIAEAESEWIACLDDDDLWYPNHLEMLVASSASADVVVALYEHSDGSPPAEHCCDYAQLRHRNWFHPSACLLRRQLVLGVGSFPEPEPPSWDDWRLWLRLLDVGARFVCVHEVTSVKGIHEGNISR